jgi:hypothetical protein
MKKVFCLIFLLLTVINVPAQTVVDKMLVTVSDGVRTELVTYSDLLWQLALEPEAALDSPSQQDLKETLDRVTQQRLIALEAERVPSAAPTKEEVRKEIGRIVARFPSAAFFETRLRRVGFESTDDPNLERIVEQRLSIDKYLDFRFRSFVVITPQEEEKFYNETYIPRFRRLNPGLVVPTLETMRADLNQELTEIKVESNMERFLAELKERAIITTLNEV